MSRIIFRTNPEFSVSVPRLEQIVSALQIECVVETELDTSTDLYVHLEGEHLATKVGALTLSIFGMFIVKDFCFVS